VDSVSSAQIENRELRSRQARPLIQTAKLRRHQQEANMALSINWTGKSGQNYGMELCQFGKPFVNKGGVYIFCRPAATANRWDPIYVGEAENFNERLNINLVSHHRLDCIKRNGATNVCALQVPGGKAARINVETDLRTALDPSCNRQ
jgi:hypothetical protein